MNEQHGAIIYKKTHLSRSISPCDDVFRILSGGLEASAGSAVVAENASALFLDGRYITAAKKYVDTNKFRILPHEFFYIVDWIAEKIPRNSVISYDPRFYSYAEYEKLRAALPNYQWNIVDLRKMLGVAIPPRKLQIHYLTNNRTAEKLEYIYDAIFKNNLDAYLLCDPSSVCWIMDMRDLETPYSPLVLSYLLVTRDRQVIVYVDESYIFDRTNVMRSKLNLIDDLKNYSAVGIDIHETPAIVYHQNVSHVANPCALPKALKTVSEIADIKCTALKDSVALINFLHWMYLHHATGVTELHASEKALYFRKMQP
ncbi:MAG: aminopeptidase P family N-terminal domain-containing protein, partial [Holosporaceae bacterium]|nr:aminopeptidase P family N-terminal domain-containing protein [Holosporaceae bacterium]